MATEFAPAKINLVLHVTGQRADGYHLLDSLVVFAGVGDRLTARAAPALSLAVTGPRGAGLHADDDNLVLRAARAMGAPPLALTLEKNLPVASGIGGGSADAAATLRLIARQTGQPLPDAAQVLALGADVPVCLSGTPARMTGIGEGVAPLPHALPPVWMVLVNPGAGVSTPMIFRAMQRRDNPPMADLPRLADAAALAAWLTTQRNDLEGPATSHLPVIAQVRAALSAQAGCLMSRMSGSGATCFGLFETETAAHTAAAAITRSAPDWWVAAAPVLN